MTPESTAAWIQALGGRRFLLTIGAGIVDTALLCFGFLTGTQYLELTLATVGAFIASINVQKHTESKNGVSP